MQDLTPLRIEYIGHASVVVDLDGVKLVTDPLLRNRVAHLKRAVPVDESAFGELDAVLISHAHYDHLDLPSLAKLGKDVRIVAPRGLGSLLEKRHFEDVVEVEAGDVTKVGGLDVEAVHAEHEGRRGPLGADAPSLGYVITGSQHVYFAGDTDLFDGMSTIASPDVALIPIWGWGPTLGQGGHLDPRRAAEAVRLLAPRVAVPIHWGTYSPIHLGLRKAPSFLELPPVEFAAAVAELAPDVAVRVLRPGEAFELEQRL